MWQLQLASGGGAPGWVRTARRKVIGTQGQGSSLSVGALGSLSLWSGVMVSGTK